MCAEKIVGFHQFFLMFMESDRRLRQLLKAEPELTELNASGEPNKSDARDETKHFEKIYVEPPVYQSPLKWECSNCLQRFKTKGLFNKHRSTCEILLPQAQVSTVSTRNVVQSEYLTGGSETSDNVPVSLNICDSGVAVKEIKIEAPSEIVNGISAKLVCTQCSSDFETADQLVSHEKTCSPAIKVETGTRFKNPDANGKWICRKCLTPFSSRETLRDHRYTHRDPNKVYKYRANYSDESGEFICDICDKVFDTKERIRIHVRRHAESKALCNVCGKWLSSRNNLSKHYRAVHLNEKKFECPICHHRFTSSFRLKNHINSHQGIRAYSCKICPNKFFTSSAAKRHMQTVHTNEKKYQCTVCGKAFNRNTNLKAHMFAHTGKYEHNCSRCGSGFRRKNKLVQHMELCRGDNFQ